MANTWQRIIFFNQGTFTAQFAVDAHCRLIDKVCMETGGTNLAY